ncbi:MAG: hypothetical protein PHE21_01035 [Candidatus Dojkabacteria bacterium]|nr:hypothetical protein [Candidatus Dojkabacteria bacterium]
MAEYIQGDLLDNSNEEIPVGGSSSADPGYTFRRDIPYSIMCKCKESDAEFPSLLSIPIVTNDINPKEIAESNFKLHREQLGKSGFDLENNTPVFFSYFEDEGVGDRALFPNYISMSFWRDREGKLYSCSTYNEFTIIGSFRNVKNSGGGIEPNVTVFDYKVFDETNTYRELIIEIVHRKGVDVEDMLSRWVASQGKNSNENKNDIYKKLLDPTIFKRNDFWNRHRFNTPLRRNPLLSLSYNALTHYFSQPTVGDKYPDWHKWLGE